MEYCFILSFALLAVEGVSVVCAYEGIANYKYI